MFIVGLTGGIGSGKTAVSTLFQQLGIVIVDADICARVVVEKGKPALTEISRYFGISVLLPTGDLDRAALRQKIFADPDAKTWLEQLLHPLIRAELNRQLQQAQSAYVIMVSPLLVESKQYLTCDRVLLVDAPEQLQIERTSKRDNNHADQVKQIMQTQTDRASRLQVAHDVIQNIHDFAHLAQEVEQLHQLYLSLATQKASS